jgi:F-type H+-transporting ATPase subunit b
MWRAWLTGFLASFLLVGLLPRPLKAQEHEAARQEDAAKQEAPAAGHAEKSAHAEEQSPAQILGWSIDLALFTIIVFLLLLFVLGRFAWKPMLEGLQKREENIRAALEDAQRARDEAQRVREQLQAEMNQSAQKVRDMMDAARRDAERATSDLMAKTRSEIQTERERLHREIDMAKDQALQQIWNQTAQLATLVSAKAIRRQLNEDDHRRLVDEAIGELRTAGNGNAR